MSKKTMIALILDRSGSMAGLKDDVIGGVNTFLKEQKELEGEAILTAVRFDTDFEVFRPMKNIKEVADIHGGEFVPRGQTALLDAIGRTISQLDHDWQTYQPDQAIVVIYTDGQENASSEFKKEQIKKLIEARQVGGKWAFVFLGANLDSFAEAQGLGIWAKSVSNWEASSKGMKSATFAASATASAMRSVGIDTYYSDSNIKGLADEVKDADDKQK